MQDLAAINILIGDRTYRVKIEPKDEQAVRKAVKVINDKVSEFKTAFAGKDMQDYIAMVLVWFATQQTDPVLNPASNGDLEEKLDNLERALDKALSNH